MNLDTAEIKVFKLIGLGKRALSDVGDVKCRPLRLSVELFDHKRQILQANALLRES